MEEKRPGVAASQAQSCHLRRKVPWYCTWTVNGIAISLSGRRKTKYHSAGH